MRNRIDNLGSVGLVADTDPSELPPQGFSSMMNVRCEGNRIEPLKGHELRDRTLESPRGVNAIRSFARTFLVYPAGRNIYAWIGGNEILITRNTDPADVESARKFYSQTDTWYTTVLGNVILLGNGLDNPQYWGGANNCLDLPWDETRTWDEAFMNAKVIRAFKNFGFALAVSERGTVNYNRVIWSHPADAGTVPRSWEISDPTTLAGDNYLSETKGIIIDGLPLRDYFIIYKEDAVYTASYTGSTFVFSYRSVSRSRGLLAQDCVCDIGGKHVCVGTGDIFLFDGNDFKSIASQRVQDYFYNSLSKTYYYRTYLIYYKRRNEVWICYPTEDSETGWCDRALIWNVETNVWYPRELPGTVGGVEAIVSPKEEYTWDTLPYATWEDWGINPVEPPWTYWDEQQPKYDPTQEKLVMLSALKTIPGSLTVTVDVELEAIQGDYGLLTRTYPIEADADQIEIRANEAQVLTWTYNPPAPPPVIVSTSFTDELLASPTVTGSLDTVLILNSSTEELIGVPTVTGSLDTVMIQNSSTEEIVPTVSVTGSLETVMILNSSTEEVAPVSVVVTGELG